MRKLAACFAVWAVVLASPAPAKGTRHRRPPAGDHVGHLNVGGVDRTYILHIPESLPESVPVPLVLVFHGGGGHAATLPNFTRFDSLAEREKFLVGIRRASTRAGTTPGGCRRRTTSDSSAP